jgi:hypothetical protein
MTLPISSCILQKAFKQQLTSNQIQEALNFQKVIQTIRPELARLDETSTSIPRLVNIENKKIAVHQNPAVVFDSLLHKSASRERSPIGFEESIKYL